MQRLLRNKKGTVIGDLFGGISSSISHFLQSAPKPVLIIIFLAFLLFFSVIFSFFLNITGNFCDTAGNEYKTGTFNLVGNIGLLSSMPSEEELDSSTLEVKEPLGKSTLLECSLYVYSTATKNWTYDNNDVLTQIPDGYYFRDDGCILCNEVVRAIPPEGSLLSTEICFDNFVYPKDYEDMKWIEKRTCGKFLGRCDVPNGYYYDSNNNVFVCNSELCLSEEGVPSTQGDNWNLKLQEQGAKLTPPSTHGDRDYRNALRIECDIGDLNPKLRVFGVNPFDYRLWIFLFILSALIWVVFKIKRR